MANNSQYPGIQPPRPPISPMGPPPNAYPPVPMQFRTAGPPRQPPPYMPMMSQQFMPVGRPNMMSQPMQHLPPRAALPALGMVPPPSTPPAPQSFSGPDGQPSRPVMSVSPQPQHVVPMPNGYIPAQSGPRVAPPLAYNLSTSANAPVHGNAEAASQYQPTPLINMPSFPLGVSTGAPVLQPAEQTSAAPTILATTDLPKAVERPPSDWIEHISHKGKRYYHNKKTKQSSWEKPLDLMSPTERADATTNWKECHAPSGKKYYYNKVTKQSKWRLPDELKLARGQVIQKCTVEEQKSMKHPDNESLIPSVTPGADSPSSRPHEPPLSPVSVAPSIAAVQLGSLVTSELSVESVEPSKLTTNEEAVAPAMLPNPVAPPLDNTEDVSMEDAIIHENETPVGTIEEPKGNIVMNDSANVAASEENAVDQETQVYDNKQEAKNAFKALLDSVNVASDWTWEQAMRLIINDRRYVALRSLGERKQAFTEYVGQKKKQESEERRNKQKKAREEFKKMLEDSKEITSSTKWSKAIAIFEDDDRFKAVERPKEREDIYDEHLKEIEKQERSKALEENKRNRKDYIEFLKSCDFITASSQWRRVQDRLEADESCLRLEKIDRLEIFQEYIRDLEKEEEEQRKLRLEELRKNERKNRDEFRKLMDEHIASGMLTAKTHWRDYLIKVKDLPAYFAVSSNTNGATPKDLFDDVIEELEKQFIDDRDRIKEAVMMKKVSILSTWTLEDFKNSIAEDISSPAVSDANLKIVFDDLHERVREKEENETKRRKHLADDFYRSLTTSKDISSSSRWEDFKPLFESRFQNWFTIEESFFREIYDKYIAELKKEREERKHREDKAKGRDRDRRRREKDRGKKDKRRKDEIDNDDGDNREDKEKKHRKRHLDDTSLDETRDTHRHSAERKKSKQLEQQSSALVEHENRHKRHKRDHRRGGDHDDHKVGEDGEFR
uniref:pre-mRNA-processing protein 40A-like n=1 Tax=Erigeron canadensis TaxID=72917 RepID=UPI001CB8F495|nr:pre-mRNA-processing protein 40A-like [Erigeron canadensis]